MFFKSKGKDKPEGAGRRRGTASGAANGAVRVVRDRHNQRFQIDGNSRKICKEVNGQWVPLPPEERTIVRIGKKGDKPSSASAGAPSPRPRRQGHSTLGEESGGQNRLAEEGTRETSELQARSAKSQDRRKARRAKKGQPKSGGTKGKTGKRLIALLVVVLCCIVVAVAIKSKQGSATPAAQVQQTSQQQQENQGGQERAPAKENLSLAKSEQPLYILLVGVDDKKPSEADALFVVAINRDRKDIDIIGIPSDTKVESRDKKKVDSLKSMYSSGGVMLTKAVVEDMFHITIPYYVVMDERAFGKTVDKVGNYDLYVEENMTHSTAAGVEDIRLRQGYQQLTGQSALGYVRYVDKQTSDFGRVQRQERFMKQYFKLSNDTSVFTRMWRLWRLWGSYTSNISTFDIVKLAWDTRSYKDEDFHFFIVPGVWEKIGGDTYWNVDPTEAQRLVGITMGNESTDVVQALEPGPNVGDDKVGKVADSKVDGPSDGAGSKSNTDDGSSNSSSSNTKSSKASDNSSSKTRKDTHE